MECPIDPIRHRPHPHTYQQRAAATTTMAAEKGASRKDALLGAGLSAGALLFGAGVLTPGAANAEFTPSQRKQQYFRYAPRIKGEIRVWCGGVRPLD